jgi:hypothetical protein
VRVRAAAEGVCDASPANLVDCAQYAQAVVGVVGVGVADGAIASPLVGPFHSVLSSTAGSDSVPERSLLLAGACHTDVVGGIVLGTAAALAPSALWCSDRVAVRHGFDASVALQLPPTWGGDGERHCGRCRVPCHATVTLTISVVPCSCVCVWPACRVRLSLTNASWWAISPLLCVAGYSDTWQDGWPATRCVCSCSERHRLCRM